MNRKQFLANTFVLGVGSFFKKFVPSFMIQSALQVQHIRNATLTITYNGVTLLVDPLLSKKNMLDPIPWTNNIRNPLVDLPFDDSQLQRIIDKADAVLLTHLHLDHWDSVAQQRIPRSITIVCQEEDVNTLQEQGFHKLLDNKTNNVKDVFQIERVPAKHGHGELAAKMAPVSGYIIKAGGYTIYLAGDSVWYEGIKHTIEQYRPDIIIVNAGAAQFQFGEPITMTAEDVAQVIQTAPETSKVIAVHMEAINHCYLKRIELKEKLSTWKLEARCLIPADGETMNF
ncbi:MAG TPA: MBL fold metallo-hydrolase [Flavisolibacter sp.]|nr:MBL fold metallo-hydrolase [Flavisolibacter sp.]